MTPEEIKAEKRYRMEERVGILTDGRREPTPEEFKTAWDEACAFEVDLEREALVERVFALSMAKKRDRQLERQFGK